jgi:multidrug efflux pump subunit AcrA (membrane-fusion protein)
MNTKLVISGLLLAVVVGRVVRLSQPLSPPTVTSSVAGARKILYYQSSMHPWIKSDRPGKCPICGMNLVPVYEGDAGVNQGGGVQLKADSISVLNVQSVTVARRPIVRTLQVAGIVDGGAGTNAWFVFDAYERDLAWLRPGQSVAVTIPDLPGNAWTAIIQPAAGQVFDPGSGSTKMRALITDGHGLSGGGRPSTPFSGLYAEGAISTESPEVLAVPRSAVLSPGGHPIVYVDEAAGRYEPRQITSGRTGDDFTEVVAGLQPGDKVVTTGNLLIDAETQISQSGNP